jgi:hypothetical protein
LAAQILILAYSLYVCEAAHVKGKSLLTLQAARRFFPLGRHFPNPSEFQMHGRRGYYHARLTNWHRRG